MTATAPDALLLLPLLAHVGLTFLLYAWLTVVRVDAVRKGQASFAAYEFGKGETPAAARISKNLSNQFELPVIFYATVVLLILLRQDTMFDVACAWIFVAGRVAHSAVQTLTDRVPLRGAVFTINFLAVIALVVHLGLAVLVAI